MTDLAVVIPSRGRPGQAAALADAIEHTCITGPAVLVAVDVDDPDLPGYQQALQGRPATVHVVAAPGGHVAALNDAARTAAAAAFAVVKLDDDHMPLTYGWDSAYLTALRALGTGIVYGNDLLQQDLLPTAPGMSSDIIRALGFMGPPQLRHLFVDDYWRELGRQAGCLRYLPHIVVEHRHPIAGKAQLDAGYVAANAPQRYAADGAAWAAYQTGRLPADVAAVRALRR